MKTPVEVKETEKERIPKGFHKITLGKLVTFKEGVICQKIAEKKEIILS
jgi:hypothetical protein